MDLTLRQLRYFIAAVEHGTIVAAAEEHMVSPVALRQGLIDLEKQLGVELLKRSRSKGVSITPAGEAIAAQVRTILCEVDQLSLLIDSANAREKSRMRIGVYYSLSVWLIPLLVQFFNEHYPEVELDFVEGDVHKLKGHLDKGKIDYFLAYGNQIDFECQRIPIRKMRPYLLVGERHPLSGSESVSLKELKDEPFLMVDISPANQIVPRILAEYGLEQNIKWRFSSVETVKGVLGTGHGVAMLFSFGQHHSDRDGNKLISIPITDGVRENMVIGCLPVGIKPSPLAGAVFEHLRSIPLPAGEEFSGSA